MNQEAQKRLRLAVLLSGQGSNAEALAQAAGGADYPATIVLVASDKPEAAGLAKAQARGLKTWSWQTKPFDKNAFESALMQVLDEYKVEAIALAGFMRLLSAAFLESFAQTRGENRIVNIHPSLLPQFRGLHAPAQALAAGAHETGATVHLVSPEMDAGAILAQASVPIRNGDSPALLHRRIQEAEHRLYPEALRAWAETLRG